MGSIRVDSSVALKELDIEVAVLLQGAALQNSLNKAPHTLPGFGGFWQIGSDFVSAQKYILKRIWPPIC
jgi:hypothetical protein